MLNKLLVCWNALPRYQRWFRSAKPINRQNSKIRSMEHVSNLLCIAWFYLNQPCIERVLFNSLDCFDYHVKFQLMTVIIVYTECVYWYLKMIYYSEWVNSFHENIFLTHTADKSWMFRIAFYFWLVFNFEVHFFAWELHSGSKLFAGNCRKDWRCSGHYCEL